MGSVDAGGTAWLGAVRAVALYIERSVVRADKPSDLLMRNARRLGDESKRRATTPCELDGAS